MPPPTLPTLRIAVFALFSCLWLASCAPDSSESEPSSEALSSPTGVFLDVL